jgi:hypothetical protein
MSPSASASRTVPSYSYGGLHWFLFHLHFFWIFFFLRFRLHFLWILLDFCLWLNLLGLLLITSSSR